MKKLAVLLIAGACSFEHGQSSNPLDVDAGIDGPPGCRSFASQVDTCTLSSMVDVVITGTATYDTSTGMFMNGANTSALTHMTVQGKAGPIDVVPIRDMRMVANARLRVTGALPFAIIAYGTVTLEAGAIIDASDGGAGARTACPNSAIAGVANGEGAGGGGGGGFGGTGGNGGTGNSDGAAVPGGTGGEAVATPTGPLGGCPGAIGGAGDDPGGSPGKGGGAIYIAALTHIEIAATAGINVGGGGGGGGHHTSFSDGDAGGGGGGAAGMIMLESAIVHAMGVLAANGGGGGEASGNGAAGDTGDAGKLSATAAPGGSGGTSTGTDGGAGSAKGVPNGTPVTATAAGGGGGGGGGAGFVVVVATDKVLGTTSP